MRVRVNEACWYTGGKGRGGRESEGGAGVQPNKAELAIRLRLVHQDYPQRWNSANQFPLGPAARKLDSKI